MQRDSAEAKQHKTVGASQNEPFSAIRGGQTPNGAEGKRGERSESKLLAERYRVIERRNETKRVRGESRGEASRRRRRRGRKTGQRNWGLGD